MMLLNQYLLNNKIKNDNILINIITIFRNKKKINHIVYSVSLKIIFRKIHKLSIPIIIKIKNYRKIIQNLIFTQIFKNWSLSCNKQKETVQKYINIVLCIIQQFQSSFYIFQIQMGNSKSLYSKEEFLYYYIERKDLVNIRKLLEAKPQLVNAPITKDSKQSALMRASYNGNMELVLLLLSLKADPNYSTPKGQTALTTAVKRDHIQVVNELINAGANIAHISQTGFRVIEYAILPGFFEMAKIIYTKLQRKDKEEIQDPQSYEKLAKKYSYRYVNYQQFLEGLVLGKDQSQLGSYLKKQKKKFVDPVVDPRQTWRQWFKRTTDWKDAPLVERSDLPENLQPQNRLLGQLHHFTNNFMSTPLSQKTHLKPLQERLDDRQVVSQMSEFKAKRQAQTNEKLNLQTQSMK